MNKKTNTMNHIPTPRGNDDWAHLMDAIPMTKLAANLRDSWNKMQAERAAERQLRQELASYTSRSDIADLMAMAERSQSPDAALVHDILSEKMLTAR